MSQVLHTIEARFAGLFGERRGGSRHQVACAARLPVGVSMENERIDPHAEHYPEPIMGRTHDVSETGLSLVLPQLNLGAERVDAAGYPLRIVLCLPSGVIIVHAATVRCEQYADVERASCYLIGARIMHMSAADQRRYDAFLRTLN